MRGCHCNIIEQAKAHSLVARGVVPGRAHRTEGAFVNPRMQGINRSNSSASRVQRSRPRTRAHRGVRINAL